MDFGQNSKIRGILLLLLLFETVTFNDNFARVYQLQRVGVARHRSLPVGGSAGTGSRSVASPVNRSQNLDNSSFGPLQGYNVRTHWPALRNPKSLTLTRKGRGGGRGKRCYFGKYDVCFYSAANAAANIRRDLPEKTHIREHGSNLVGSA